MRHPEGPRFERRLRARQEARCLAEKQAQQPKPPPVERRQQERRTRSMTSAEVEDWLKHNGITGVDRRKGDRRRR